MDTADQVASAATITPSDVAAWIALALAVLSIAAQFLARYLDGGRVLVRLNPVIKDDFGSIYTRTSGQWPMASPQPGGRPRLDPSSILELAEIVIENKGRHAVTVHEIGFAWKGNREKRRVRRTRHHAVPRVFKVDGYGPRRYLDVEDFRLEPADRVSMLFDYWTILQPDRKTPGGIRNLRASVRVAGRARPTLSARKLRWRIPDIAVSGIEGVRKLTVRGVVARVSAVTDASEDTKYVPFPAYLSRKLETHIGGSWPVEYKERHDLLVNFFESDPESGMHFTDESPGRALSLSFLIERELTAKQELIDWGDISLRHRSESREDLPAKGADAPE